MCGLKQSFLNIDYVHYIYLFHRCFHLLVILIFFWLFLIFLVCQRLDKLTLKHIITFSKRQRLAQRLDADLNGLSHYMTMLSQPIAANAQPVTPLQTYHHNLKIWLGNGHDQLTFAKNSKLTMIQKKQMEIGFFRTKRNLLNLIRKFKQPLKDSKLKTVTGKQIISGLLNTIVLDARLKNYQHVAAGEVAKQ